jgi:hypothetical protein
MAKLKHPLVTLQFVASTDSDAPFEERERQAWESINLILSTMYQADAYYGSRHVTLEWVTADEIPETIGDPRDFDDEVEDEAEEETN